MSFPAFPSWFGALFAGVIALSALLKPHRTLATWTFAGGMLLLALEAIFQGLGSVSRTPAEVFHWQHARLLATSFLPGAWLLFSLTYARASQGRFLRQWAPLWIAALVVPPGLALGFHHRLLETPTAGDAPFEWHLPLRPAGTALIIAFLVCVVLILMNLERTFRASVGTIRWRIKYVILGLFLLFGVRLYSSALALLYSQISVSLYSLNSFTLMIASVLLAVGWFRAGRAAQEVYPSGSVLRYSLTVILAGLYLAAVAILSKLVSVLGRESAIPLDAFLLLVALVGLAILLLSERFQHRLRLFVSRHFSRPYHDYRHAWLTFIQGPASRPDRDQFCRATVNWISSAFHCLSVSFWLLQEQRARFTLAASSSIENLGDGRAMPLNDTIAPFLDSLRATATPVRLDDPQSHAARFVHHNNPFFFPSSGQRVAVPVVADNKLLGLIVLGDRVNQLPFSVEDLELLKCVADQAGLLLLNYDMSRRLLELREMEAFQVMSAFFVHDLKNTASTLSLMLANLPNHFDDPAFRKDALRGLAKSVDRINELIGRLGLIRQSVQLERRPVDLNAIATAAADALELPPHVLLHRDLQPLPLLPLDPDRIQKVVANLLHNALEATGELSHPSLRLATALRPGWVTLSVSDNGCGMNPDFIQNHLFRPFHSTKKKGVGIGMFLAKHIVEAHGGSLEIESQPNLGSTFHLVFPVPSPALTPTPAPTPNT